MDGRALGGSTAASGEAERRERGDGGARGSPDLEGSQGLTAMAVLSPQGFPDRSLQPALTQERLQTGDVAATLAGRGCSIGSVPCAVGTG